MLSKVELNEDYINKIMAKSSDIFKLKHEDKLDDGKINIVIVDQSGIYYSGIIRFNGKTYSIVGDNEFNRVYPVFDKVTGKIISISHKE